VAVLAVLATRQAGGPAGMVAGRDPQGGRCRNRLALKARTTSSPCPSTYA